jgi:hypothetical protein
MDLLNPETIKEQPRGLRGGGVLAIYVGGIVGFAAWSLFLAQSDAEHAGEPLLYIEGYPVGMTALVELIEIVFLITMAGIFLGLNRRVRIESRQQAEGSSARLKQDLAEVRKRERELERANRDLERFNAMATGREQRIMDLKEEVNVLLQEMNQPQRYNTAPVE